ncbi:MAG TPA: SPFH domain-containing protein [Planctomycetota bacterium]|nr:SPFH domain-containing protein [Planctomycetota bacterium]
MIDRYDAGSGDRGNGYGFDSGSIAKTVVAAIAAIVFVVAVYFWSFCRIQVDKGEFVPLLHKTGKNLTNDMILAPDPEFSGPQLEILREGRHFRNPYYWSWPKPIKATVIDQAEVGILIRKYGKPLPLGDVIARDKDEKGILAEPLTPGRYYINLWAFDVEEVPMVKIEPGFMGVVTLKVGDWPENPNEFVVKEGERGTQPQLLPPGTHPQYSNRHVHMVTPIDVRSQKFEMRDEYGVTFLSKYGFGIKVEGVIEWAPDIEKLPELFVKYVDDQDLKKSGGIDNIQRKLILPFARSYFRTIGGQHRAVDYIRGDTRIKVQNEVERRLRESCAAEGVLIRSFVIRATEPPPVIRQQYGRREISRREIDQYEKEIETQIGTIAMEGGTPKLDEDGKPVLDEGGKPIIEGGTPKLDDNGEPIREGGRLAKVIQERSKDREMQRGGIREMVATEVRAGEQYRAVEVTKAEKDLAVAEIMLEAAKDKAAQVREAGTAEAAVTVMKNQAEAEAVKAKVTAFETGDKYAEYQFIKKLSPGIHRILSNTEGPFASLFERFASLDDEDEEASKAEK